MAPATREVAVATLRLGGANGLFLIAGPCVIESEAHAVSMAERIAAVCADLNLPYIFKTSFDKANRTSGASYRGPGMAEGLRVLRRIKNELKVAVLTDVHDPSQVGPAAEVADILQIPAFLCRQTDLLTAAGKSGRAVNIKKGQFVSPWEMKHAIEKVAGTGNQNVIVTERGSSFGYNNLVVDMRSFPILRGFGYPVVFDVTHSLQLPGWEGNQSGGQREFAEPLARAAVAAGVDGIFMEVHDNPDKALSDPATQWPLAQLRPLLEGMLAIYRATPTT
ncbi:MAG TPA: 3-deoxy-8-phosphooctulonate synthase [Candidatus Xenobia bacterium]|nr:3-deoxy-8-phosphooctulonate synthase [Candidatus Xenobia bacterium]